MSSFLTARRAAANHEAFLSSDVARLANEIQKSIPGATRSEALREAERIQRERGAGWSIVEERNVLARRPA